MGHMTIPLMVPPEHGGVLVASASSSLRERVLHSFHERRWPVQEATGGADALVKLESGNWHLLYLDRCLPDLDAEELVGIIKRRFPGIEVVVLDADNGQVLPLAGGGGAHHVSQPEQTQKIISPPGAPSRNAQQTFLPSSFSARSTTSSAALAGATEVMCGSPEKERKDAPEQSGAPERREATELSQPLPGMIGNSPVMQKLYRLVRMVAPGITTVLITGPTGSGKELVARAVHKLSPRAARPFVVVNCAAIPESLLESELFGHVRGAFTGAVQTYPGRIAAAQGGTLFLDEVGELPLSMQAKLLRFLDQKEVQRLGSSEVMRADVRVVAATNADLGLAVDERRFRGDLYYRLAAFPLDLPALAERACDIVPLANHFLRTLTPAAMGPPPALSLEAGQSLQGHSWPGNVRELQQVMERALILADGGQVIVPEYLYFPVRGGARR